MSFNKTLSNTYGILQFTSLNNHKFYAEYDPSHTTLKQIRKILLLNYSCRAQDVIPDNEIVLKLSCNGKKINLIEEDQNIIIDDIYKKYNVEHDYTNIENIYIDYNISNCEPVIMTDMEKENLNKNGFSVFVKTLTGKTITTKGLNDMIIASIKTQIMEIEGIPINQQALVWCGKRLENNETLEKYFIQDCATLHLIMRLSGGMYNETSGRNGNYGTLKNLIFVIDPDMS